MNLNNQRWHIRDGEAGLEIINQTGETIAQNVINLDIAENIVDLLRIKGEINRIETLLEDCRLPDVGDFEDRIVEGKDSFDAYSEIATAYDKEIDFVLGELGAIFS